MSAFDPLFDENHCCRVCGARHEGTASFAVAHAQRCPAVQVLNRMGGVARDDVEKLVEAVDLARARTTAARSFPTSDNYLSLVSDRPEHRKNGVMVGHVILRADEHRHTIEALCGERYADFFTLSQHASPSVRPCDLCVARRDEEMARTELVRSEGRRLEQERWLKKIFQLVAGPQDYVTPEDTAHVVGKMVMAYDELRAAGPNAEMLAFVRQAAQQLLQMLQSHCDAIIDSRSTAEVMRDQIIGFRAWLDAGGIENRHPPVRRSVPIEVFKILDAVDNYTRVMTRQPMAGETYEGILESADHHRKNLCAAAIVLGSARAAARSADDTKPTPITDALLDAALGRRS